MAALNERSLAEREAVALHLRWCPLRETFVEASRHIPLANPFHLRWVEIFNNKPWVIFGFWKKTFFVFEAGFFSLSIFPFSRSRAAFNCLAKRAKRPFLSSLYERSDAFSRFALLFTFALLLIFALLFTKDAPRKIIFPFSPLSFNSLRFHAPLRRVKKGCFNGAGLESFIKGGGPW